MAAPEKSKTACAAGGHFVAGVLRLRRPKAGRSLAARVMLAGLVAVLAAGSMGAASSSDATVRYSELGHQMMCVCSCAQVLIECNHVGCPDSDGMLHMLRASLARGDSDQSILEAFQAKYGPTVLAAPMLTRFNEVAWIVPPAVLAFGLLGAVLLIRRWRLVHHEKAPVAVHSPGAEAARARIRRETEL